MSTRMTRGLAAITMMAILVLAGSVLADTMIKQEIHTGEINMMGNVQPESWDTTTFWIGDGMACTQSKGSMAILDVDKATITMVLPEQKAYAEIPADFLGRALDAAKKSEDPTVSGMAAMMGKLEATVTPTEETKTIGDYDTRKFDVTWKMAMMSATGEMWIDESVDFDYEMFAALNNAAMSRLEGFKEAFEEMKQLKGLQVASTTTLNMMGNNVDVVSKLLEFDEDAEPPAGIYEIPEGYTKIDADGMMGM